jgi:hypothetical protein
MLTFTPDDVAFLNNTVSLATSIGIENIIIENDLIRGTDENRTVVLLSDAPGDLSFDTAGLGRVGVLNSRLTLVKDDPNLVISSSQNSDNSLKQLKLKTNQMSVDYQCMNPSLINAPKKMKDTFAYTVTYTEECVTILSKACRAMGSDKDSNLTIAATSKIGKITLSDVTGDTFEYTDQVDVDKTDKTAEDHFIHNYNADRLISLLKMSDDDFVEIGHKGLLKISVDGYTIYLTPRTQ